ncbi:MAG: T9SS type A sorting domain-containing protein [Candidatus Marinimicrobia bacterium]|nr:T9SS type A sorting domain-containing protein [Candidatus Neomarinimicrobiota bacterium]
MIPSKIRSVLISIAVMIPILFSFAQADNFIDEEIRPARGEYHPNPNRSLSTRDIDIFLSNLDGIDANVDFEGWYWDYFLEYYVPPADGYINSIDFHFSEFPDYHGGRMYVWIFETNYPWSEINTEDIADLPMDAWLGYYDEFSGFEIAGSSWIFGGINNIEGAIDDKVYDPLGAQAWPVEGFGEISLEPSTEDEGWISFDLVASMGSVYEFTRDVPFIVVITRPEMLDSYGPEWRTAFYAAQKHVEPQPTMKFYGTYSFPDGRTGNSDWGWYIRSYVWDWDVHVTLTGDRGPVISNWTQLGATLDHGPRTVTVDILDDNPAGGTFGIASAELLYAVDGGDYMPVELTENDTAWIAEIPGFAEGHVDYYFRATDINDLTTTTSPFGYDIFIPSAPRLVVFNGGAIDGYPYQYYFGVGDFNTYTVAQFAHDVWAGEITEALAAHYTIIYEFSHFTDGPEHDNREVIRSWLAGGDKYYFLAGDELLSSWSNGVDRDYAVGDFEYDVLGLSHVYNDIVSSTNEVTPIEAIAGNVVTGELFTAHTAASDTLLYDPVSEVDGLNRLDGFDPVDPADVNMISLGSEMRAIGLNRISEYGHIVFLAFDPLSMNASPYTWWGFSAESPQTHSLDAFFWIHLAVEDRNEVNPLEFRIVSAFPNPFNPSVTIEYDLPEQSSVSLIIYDISGRVVQTLFSREQTPGSYEVSWDGINQSGKAVAGGMYFARLQAGEFSSVIKMVYLR